MAQFVYNTRTSAGTPSGVPATWPFGWLYPGDGNNTPYPTSPISGGNIPGIPWPPLWPPVITAGTTVVVEVQATISRTTHTATVESYVLINGLETGTSVYDKHLLQVTVSEGGAARLLRKSGGAAYQSAIFYQISNYAGNRYGFSQTVDFDPADWTVLDLIDIQSKLVTAVANPNGTDQWAVVS